jgi:hypothetical protein
MDNIGYIRVGDSVMVVQVLGYHNRHREDVVDDDLALFRTNKIRVLDILNINGQRTGQDKLKNSYNPSEIYRVNQIYDYEVPIEGSLVGIKKQSFDYDPNNVNGKGFKYYLTFMGAKYSTKYPPKGYRGIWNRYTTEGVLFGYNEY